MIESLSLKCIFSIKKPVIEMAGKILMEFTKNPQDLQQLWWKEFGR